MVPVHLRRKMWATYRPGQEIDKCPGERYLEAQQAAIAAVAVQEGR